MSISIQGVVSSVVKRLKDSILFNLKCGEATFKVTCPFFCPVQDGDVVYVAECRQDTQLELTCITQPFVAIPDDKDRIKEQFFKILRGSGFGVVSASKLYDHIANLARECEYGKDFAHKASKITSLSVNNRTRYSGDGVDAFLSEMSAQYNEYRSKNIPTMFANNFELKINSGINFVQACKLLSEWYNKRSLRKLYMMGLTKTEIANSDVSLDDLYDICITNPYRIASIHLEKCERILASIRRVPEPHFKTFGKVNRYVYNNTYSRNYTCTPELELRKAYPFYDQMSVEDLKEYYLISDNSNVYTTQVHKIEMCVVNYIDALIRETAEYLTFKSKSSMPNIRQSFYECKTLTTEQESAIDGALNCKLSVITGSAGTGKSTILREITRNLELRNKSFSICAFTGKAVARLHEIMQNNTATTIDRLIMDIKKGNTLVTSHIIIDEGSMVTTELFYRLIKAIEDKSVSITIVGDCNQLPPIGWGNVMREIMNSNRVPLFYLTKNQRIIAQSSDSTTAAPSEAKFDRFLLENANNLVDRNRDLRVPMNFQEGEGFYILPGKITTVCSILSALKSSNYNPREILILSPYKMYLNELNSLFQSIFLSDAYKFEQATLAGVKTWCVGDRVMMTRNNYEIGVMNGEEGTVDEITDDGLKVIFRDTMFTFKYDQGGFAAEEKEDDPEAAKSEEIDELKSSDLIHSYAVSVHKSQGSEAKYVILFIPEDRAFTNFLNINLLYTAMTRTKKTLWLVSSKELLGKISMCPLNSKTDGMGAKLRSMKHKDLEKVLETFLLVPQFNVSLNESTGITAIPSHFDLEEDNELEAMYGDIWS